MTSLDRITAALRESGSNGLTVNDLVNLLYADRADGGPEDAHNTIRVMMYQLRKRGVNLERVTTYRVRPRR